MIRRPPESQAAAREAFERLCKADERSDADVLVYADWLTEQGSSWGEFISASRRGDERRARQLLSADRAQWLGRIAPFLTAHPLEFVGGLPYLAQVVAQPLDALLENARATEWLLFRELEVRTGATVELLPLLLSPALRRLRGVHGLSVGLLEALTAAGGLKKLRALGCTGHVREGDYAPLPFPLELLTHFEQLDSFTHEGTRLHATDLERLIDLETPRLQRLTLRVHPDETLAWDALADAPHVVPDLTIASAVWQKEKNLRVRLWGAPRFERIELFLGAKFERALPLQLELLRRLRLKDREVTVVPARALSADERTMITDHLAPRAKRLAFTETLAP
ncbi:MAG: hypothetical protein U0228_20300 [Myxococcaceae bacterium]